MTTTVIRSTPRRGVAEIRFNRPDRLNAVVEALFRDTLDAFAERLAAQAPLSIALAKGQLNRGAERAYDTALVTELEGFSRAC